MDGEGIVAEGVRADGTIGERLVDGVRHILRLDEDLTPFYALAGQDPDLAWATRGAGRMLRSPTVLEDVVKTTVWLEDARDFDEFNRVYAEFFPGNKPSRSTLQAKNMVGTKIEIEAIAYKD